MTRKNIFSLVAGIVLFIFILNSLANMFYWYSSVWYFDLFMHFLGGAWLGVFFIWYFYNNLLEKGFNKENFIKNILFVFLVGFLWEIFEIVFNNIIAGHSFDSYDTFTDLIADLLGGIFSFISFKKLLK
jgi:hypothetical protein